MKRLWSILFFLSLAWIVLGIVLSIQTTDQTISNSLTPSASYSFGAGIGGLAGASIFLCTGIVGMCLFGFLWVMSRWKPK